MERIWIVENGETEEIDLAEIIKNYISEKRCYIAYACDAFYSGMCNGTESIVKDYAKLLELRIFDENIEFMARRSIIGNKFLWRYIDDREIKNRYSGRDDSLLPPDMEMLYSDEEQIIDINTEKSIEKEGETDVISTNGGRYTLPIKNKEGLIKIRIYYSYDLDGMATAEDYRLCTFS